MGRMKGEARDKFLDVMRSRSKTWFKDPWLTVSILAWAYIASLPLAMVLFHRAMVQEGVRGAATWSAGLSVREQIRLSSNDAA